MEEPDPKIEGLKEVMELTKSGRPRKLLIDWGPRTLDHSWWFVATPLLTLLGGIIEPFTSRSHPIIVHAIRSCWKSTHCHHSKAHSCTLKQHAHTHTHNSVELTRCTRLLCFNQTAHESDVKLISSCRHRHCFVLVVALLACRRDHSELSSDLNLRCRTQRKM